MDTPKDEHEDPIDPTSARQTRNGFPRLTLDTLSGGERAWRGGARKRVGIPSASTHDRLSIAPKHPCQVPYIKQSQTLNLHG